MTTKSEKVNLAATIIGPILCIGFISWVGWSIDVKLDLRQAQTDKVTVSRLDAEHQYVLDNFVQKDWFTSVSKNTNQHLESIDATLAQVQIEVAKINGKLNQ